MAIFTSILNLLKKNPATDGADTFNIQTMLNDNWDKIDAAMALKGVDGDVRVATTANITLSGLQTVDGVVLAAGDRVLVKNQTTGSQNGIYVAASGAWTRATDADSSAKVAAGISVYVRAGTVNVGKTFIMSNSSAVILGTTAITFAEQTAGYLDQSVKTTASPTFVNGAFTGEVNAPTFRSSNPNNTSANIALSWLSDIPRIRIGGSGAGTANGFEIQGASDAKIFRIGSNGQVVNYAAQGVAPFNVTSTTVNANFNADTVDGKHAADLMQKGGVQANTVDLNTLTAPGVYRLSGSNPNMPTSLAYGQLLVMYGGGDTVAQFGVSYSNNDVYVRSGNPSDVGGTGTWGIWRKVWNEGNDGTGSGLDADTVDGFHLDQDVRSTAGPTFSLVRAGSSTSGFVRLVVGGSGSYVQAVNPANDGSQTLWLTGKDGVATTVRTANNTLDDGSGGATFKNAVIDRGATNTYALKLISSSGGWGSGMHFENTQATGRTYGMYSGADGNFHMGTTSADILMLKSDLSASFAGSLTVAGSSGNFGVSAAGNSLTFSRGDANYVSATTAAGYLNFIVNGQSNSDANAALRLAADYSANFRGKVVAPIVTDGNSFKKLVGNVVFAASIANQKADLYFPASAALSGYLDVTITGGWNAVNGTGRLTKRLAFTVSGSGTVSAQETRYTEAIGGIKSQIAISDLSWDSANSRWRAQIAKIGTSTGAETFTLIIEGASQNGNNAPNMMAAALGAAYTTDTTVLPAPKVTLPDLAASMVAKPMSVTEFNVTSASLAQFLTASSVPAGNYNAMIYLRVTAATTVSVSVNYADATGAQSTVVVSAQAFTVGSYSLLPVFFNANANSNIILLASSSVSGAVKVSASILGV